MSIYLPCTGQGNWENWNVIEDKSKIASGTTLSGSFNAPETLSHQSQLRFYFTRAIGTKGVSYEFEMTSAEDGAD